MITRDCLTRKSVLVNWLEYSRHWQFQLVVWAFLAWHLLPPASAQKKLEFEKYWEQLFSAYGKCYHAILSCWSFLSILLAVPLAFYFANQWLQQYEYRIEVTWWVFAVTGIVALAITLITVSYQSFKAALMDPVNSLRSE